MSNFRPLDAAAIELTGNHLIEASAGTGKTFNITRIYLRLLLEKQLTVEQILVMTFTKDATEEIRGRIGEVLRDSLKNWSTLIKEDEFFIQLAQRVSDDEAKLRLKKALLFLDEAAIFTLHGFCSRVLSEYAFDSGLSFSLSMESDCQDLFLESVQDWYRLLAKQDHDDYLLIAEFWSEPEQFLGTFYSAIVKASSHNAPNIQVRSEQEVKTEFQQLVSSCSSSLDNHQQLIHQTLIESQSGNKKQARLDELNQLRHWLTEVNDNFEHYREPFPGAFIDGRRYSRSGSKAELSEAFSPFNLLKDFLKKLDKQLAQSQAFAIAYQGVKKVISLVTEKKSAQDLLSFDDLIDGLASILASQSSKAVQQDNTNSLLADKLAQQYPVALVDEFQDTDANQFTILTRVYRGTNNSALYLIGDPKQAIYGFRGGDIFTYINARNFCQYHWMMDTNWRSTLDMVTGYNRLFYGNTLNSQSADVFGFNIPYFPVKPSPKAVETEVANNNADKALQFVLFQPQDLAEKAKVPASFRANIASWCAAKISQLLVDDSQNIQSQDIAVLVRDGTEAKDIKNALQACGLASVYLSNRANLWHSTQAQQLLLVFNGILFLENDNYFVAALASGLMGYEHQALAQLQADELAWQEKKFAFIALRNEWLKHGFISMALQLLHNHIDVKRDKNRALTNILHIFELLQSASQRHKQPQELLYWFEQQCNSDYSEQSTELRLESDEQLIKIVTQHGSKGLEYPIVFVPFATKHKDPLKQGRKNITVLDYHDPQQGHCLSLGADDNAKAQMAEQAYAEAIRLLYVAVTRAEKRCYLVATNFEHYAHSPLGKTLKLSEKQTLLERINTMVEDNPDSIGLTLVDDDSAHMHHSTSNDVIDTKSDQQLAEQALVSKFNGSIERDWWLSSFSALSRNARHVGVSSPDRDKPQDLIITEADEDHLTSAMSEVNSIRFNLTKGAHTGNFLHDLMEHSDFVSDQWQHSFNSISAKYADLINQWSQSEFEHWLNEVITTPLTQPNHQNTAAFSLSDISSDNKLAEQEFYFPMEQASSKQLIDILVKHRARINQGTQGSQQIGLPDYRQLKGMMHGFIDLIFCYQGKFYLCDYKSTHLGANFDNYQQELLQANIQDNYYDLQYLIYSLALHRQLSLIIDNYSPEQHFGGVYYLYLRGMQPSNENPSPGVFYTDVTTNELARLDEMFKRMADDK